jgi:phosphatidylethanolamine/phosphatidyl-N-methylethanolamine N-methyltransferase
MRKAYARWAPVYDVVYDRLTAPARRAAVNAAMRCGTKILEVGVGTGLSLGDYPKHAHVMGIDLSEHMLRRAVRKTQRRGWQHIEGLAVMDACNLGFQDHSFDAIVSQFVITLVPDPEKALDEFARLLKPGGEIILVNHFGAHKGLTAKMEQKVAPLVAKIGWSSTFQVTRVKKWAEAHGMVTFEDERPLFPAGFFRIVRLKKT